MIVYSPINGEILTNSIKYYPRTAFVMTQLGGTKSKELDEIRSKLSSELNKYSFAEKDALSLVTGGDLLDKIWKIILGVPLGIAILTSDMPQKTISNIYYELGLMDALGKETIIIKSAGYEIPSDLIRTEYISYNENFDSSFSKFIDNISDRETHYDIMAEALKVDPVSSIEYLKRAYLINPFPKYVNTASSIYLEYEEHIDTQSKIHIKGFLKEKEKFS